MYFVSAGAPAPWHVSPHAISPYTYSFLKIISAILKFLTL